MIIRQAKNSYIRCTETYGYITNQLTRLDRVYNETGAFFLRQIGRTPTGFDTILNAAVAEYGEDSYDEIAQDLEYFLLAYQHRYLSSDLVYNSEYSVRYNGLTTRIVEQR